MMLCLVYNSIYIRCVFGGCACGNKCPQTSKQPWFVCFQIRSNSVLTEDKQCVYTEHVRRVVRGLHTFAQILYLFYIIFSDVEPQIKHIKQTWPANKQTQTHTVEQSWVVNHSAPTNRASQHVDPVTGGSRVLFVGAGTRGIETVPLPHWHLGQFQCARSQR